MTLQQIVEELDSLDKANTIYVAEPWMENSKAMVLPEPEEGGLPLEAKKLGLKYFLGMVQKQAKSGNKRQSCTA